MGIRESSYDLAEVAGAAPPLGSIRAWLRDLLVGFAAGIVADIELLVTELVTNAYEHGAGCAALRMYLAADRAVVRLEVDDRSPHLRIRPPEGADLSSPGGRGLVLIAAISADWGVDAEPGRKTVWAEIPLA
jgi:anti-sigma regulatory factor (Ser/Thr protein kinase)